LASSCALSLLAFLIPVVGAAQAQQAQQGAVQEKRESGPPQRIPRQKALTTGALDGVVREAVNAGGQRPVGGAAISLRNLNSAQGFHSSASAEGIFRLFPLPPGRYELRVESEGYEIGRASCRER